MAKDLKQIVEQQLNEGGGYIESMDIKLLNDAVTAVKKVYLHWAKGPMTEKGDLKPAKKDLISYIESRIIISGK